MIGRLLRGWRPCSIWCVLDELAHCKVRMFCDAHDRHVTFPEDHT